MQFRVPPPTISSNNANIDIPAGSPTRKRKKTLVDVKFYVSKPYSNSGSYLKLNSSKRQTKANYSAWGGTNEDSFFHGEGTWATRRQISEGPEHPAPLKNTENAPNKGKVIKLSPFMSWCNSPLDRVHVPGTEGIEGFFSLVVKKGDKRIKLLAESCNTDSIQMNLAESLVQRSHGRGQDI